MNRFLFFITIGLLINSTWLAAQPILNIQLISDGFDSPVDIAHAGDGRLFVVEQPGRIQLILEDGTVASTPFMDLVSVVRDAESEEGMLGLVFHPNYASNGYFYINYIVGSANTRRSRISRFSVSSSSPNTADIASEQIILEIDQPHGNHNAGDLAFGPDGYLYIPTGDGGSGGDPDNRSQDGLDLLGKILRIDVNNGSPYAIPADNPFVNDATVLNEIWSIGWRNPWRFSFDRLTGDMWVGDVGQNAVEEISMEPANSPGGLNYGWRCYEGEAVYNLNPDCGAASGYVDPIFDYPQNTSNWGKSVTGGFVYRGQDYPALYGRYVFADYVTNNMWTLHDSLGIWVLTAYGKQISGVGKISTFGEDVDGELYMADIKAGKVFRIMDSSTPIDPAIVENKISVFPHPWTDQLEVEFPNPNQRTFTLSIYDINGQIVRMQSEIQDQQIVLDRQSLPVGIYMIELTGEDGQAYRRKILAIENK